MRDLACQILPLVGVSECAATGTGRMEEWWKWKPRSPPRRGMGGKGWRGAGVSVGEEAADGPLADVWIWGCSLSLSLFHRRRLAVGTPSAEWSGLSLGPVPSGSARNLGCFRITDQCEYCTVSYEINLLSRRGESPTNSGVSWSDAGSCSCISYSTVFQMAVPRIRFDRDMAFVW
jgi:hypothetical protein